MWIDQQNKIGSPEIDPNTYKTWVYDKDSISNSRGEDKTFKYMMLGYVISHLEKIQLVLHFIPYKRTSPNGPEI